MLHVMPKAMEINHAKYVQRTVKRKIDILRWRPGVNPAKEFRTRSTLGYFVCLPLMKTGRCLTNLVVPWVSIRENLLPPGIPSSPVRLRP